MNKAALFLASAGLITAPVQAADWSGQQTGTFVGVRLMIGGKTGARPQAALTLAPTQHRISLDGSTSMKLGEGLAINLTPGAKPTLTLAGVRADRLSLTSSSTGSTGEKLGMSEGAKIALGIGAAVLVGSGVLYAVATHCGDHEDECP